MADSASLLRRCTFPPAVTPVACAVSGGADSLALLVLAAEAGCTVTAIHVDHGLRPGSAAEADIVRAAAGRFGAAFQSLRVAVELGPNLEARARAARYAVLPDGVLTGHTADDQAETVLLNLLRGAALDGLAGMAPERRPLRRLRRHETHELCTALDLAPVMDPSNEDPAFRRNRVRHEVIPLLNAVAERDVVPVLARQADLLRGDAAVLDELAAELDPTDAPALATAPPALARRAIRGWLRGVGPGGAERYPPDGAVVARVLAVCRGEAVACEVGGGWRVARRQNRLEVEPPPEHTEDIENPHGDDSGRARRSTRPDPAAPEDGD